MRGVKKSFRQLSAAVASIAVAAAGVVIAPGAAHAVPGNAVVLGDSLAANPAVVDYLAGKANVPLPGARINGAGCGTDFLFSSSYGAASGKPVDDFTCAGASYRTGGMHISEQVQRAADAGVLNGDTSDVVIFAGANDTYPYVLGEHMPVPEIQENLRAAARDAVNQARSFAPNARIKLIGYPQVSDASGGVCIINVTPGPSFSLPGVYIGEIEQALQDAVAQAAGDTGAQFVDSKGISSEHNTCSGQRWVAGLIDTTATKHNLMFHMTDIGLQAVGDAAGRV